MKGETQLDKLLQHLDPVQVPGEYVFCTGKVLEPAVLREVIGSFRETEGMTYILPRTAAHAAGLEYDGSMAWITLQVHSSLHAVGLTAAFASALAGAGISCNVVAAYYHDHLFVPFIDAERALSILQSLRSAT